ncbi:MAG: hypothetical protein JSV79_13850 [Armatimonadota bacterium]|nr:MAG: hypothetical protein JSV79_13850 [Armatimonadota bacterium]
MYATETKLIGEQTRPAASADLPPELGTHAPRRTAAEPTADPQAAPGRAIEAEALAQHMDREARRYLEMSRHLDAALNSGKLRRRAAWQRTDWRQAHSTE